jgi:hypothetical protein
MHLDKDTKALVAAKMRELHYWAGLTLNAAQGLEYGCKLVIFLLAEQKLVDYSVRDAQALMDVDQKKTFGQVLKTLKKYVPFDANQEGLFMEALQKRNWFIHEFYSARGENLVDHAGRESGIRELKILRKLFLEADAIIKPIIRQLMLHFYKKDIDNLSQEGLERILCES